MCNKKILKTIDNLKRTRYYDNVKRGKENED